MGQALRFGTLGVNIMSPCNAANEPVIGIAMTDAEEGEYADVCFGGYCAVLCAAGGGPGTKMDHDSDGNWIQAGNTINDAAPVRLIAQASIPGGQDVVLGSGYFQPGQMSLAQP